LEQDKKTTPLATNTAGGQKRSIWLYAVVGVGLIVATIVWGTKGKTANLSAEQLTDKFISETFENPSVHEGKTEPSAWIAAKQAYAKRDFAAVAQGIETIEETTDEQIFYQSLSFLYQKPPNLDKSAEGFVLLMRRNMKYADESRWFYTLIALKKGEKEAAMSMLQNVIGKRNVYSEQAAELLKKL
jgi:hypothetical protein